MDVVELTMEEVLEQVDVGAIPHRVIASIEEVNLHNDIANWLNAIGGALLNLN